MTRPMTTLMTTASLVPFVTHGTLDVGSRDEERGPADAPPCGAPAGARPPGPLDAVGFDTTGTRMAVSSDDASVTTWDLSGALPTAPTGRIGNLGGFVYAVSFAADDTTLVASVLSGHADLIDTGDLAHPRLLGQQLTGPQGYVYSAAFSPTGHVVAASGNDKTIWLWDVTDPAHPRALGQPLVWADGYATNVLFSPDGRMLAAGMTDGTVRVWDLTTQAATTAVCTPARAGLTMTPDEWSRLADPLAQPALCG